MTKKTIVGVQFLFVAFGATVLVPLLIGIDPATALFTAGVGTFLFHFITGGKVPIFLGSSFAFIAPIIAASKQWGLPGTIASVGVQNLMQNKVDMNNTRNVIIISVMLTMGLGGAVLSSGNFAISGIGLSAVIGVILNLVLPKKLEEEKVEE